MEGAAVEQNPGPIPERAKDDSFEALFRFYYQHVKPLYAEVQAHNKLPQETLFELNAAFDHVSRHYRPLPENGTHERRDTESEAARKALSHLKRSCLDIYKLELIRTNKLYDELNGAHCSLIDNGRFKTELDDLIREIRRQAALARTAEGSWVKTSTVEIADIEDVFERWMKVSAHCKRLERDFYQHPGINWAKRKVRQQNILALLISFVMGVASGVTGNWVFAALFGAGESETASDVDSVPNEEASTVNESPS